jgi:hypothetical protein
VAAVWVEGQMDSFLAPSPPLAFHGLRPAPAAAASIFVTCPCRNLILGYIGGVVRPELASPAYDRRSARSAGSVRPCAATSVCEPRCTIRQHNAHRTEEREILYPWHPWFGRRVFVHEVLVRGNARIFRCSETVQATYRRFEIPEWMFERAACCGMARAESPRVSRAALDGLKAVILGAFGATAGAMIEAGPGSFSREGEADATSRTPASYPTTGTVSPRRCKTGMAPTARGGTRESEAPDGAHAARAAAPHGLRPGNRRGRG